MLNEHPLRRGHWFSVTYEKLKIYMTLIVASFKLYKNLTVV